MLKYPCDEHSCIQKVNILHLFSDHVMLCTHHVLLICVHDYFHYTSAKLIWITDENNRRIIGMLGRIVIIGGIFKNRIIGKIKSILGSGLYNTQGVKQSVLFVCQHSCRDL